MFGHFSNWHHCDSSRDASNRFQFRRVVFQLRQHNSDILFDHIEQQHERACGCYLQSTALIVRSSGEASRSPIKLPPTVVVFRDEHQEEVERYVIQGTDLYTSADYWNSWA